MSTILFAAGDLDQTVYLAIGLVAAVGLVLSAFFLVVFTRCYKRCPSNRILVIYGKTGKEGGARCLHGGAAFVIPLIQDYAWMSLEPMRITVSARPLLKCESTEFRTPQIFSVAIGVSKELMTNAAIRMLGLGKPEIDRHAEDIIATQLDRLVDLVQSGNAQMDPEQFHRELETSLEPKLNELGLTLINFRRE